MKSFDCIVIGGGHAGIEAAAACARCSLQTLLISFNLDTIGQMSCNPSIGGIGKGQLVREVDALGGLMAKIIDQTGIHFKMLNLSKGPAMWAPRAQAEKKGYQNYAKALLEKTENLSLYQDECSRLIISNARINGVVCKRGREFLSRHVILTTGTFLGAKIHIGKFQQSSGRVAELASNDLAQDIFSHGLQTKLLKTGTPPRILGKHIDYTVLEKQQPDPEPCWFSFCPPKNLQTQIPCWITYTNQKTHQIIQENLKQSPIYSGQIKSSGPRYCPSIEDKVVRFPDRRRHQIFIEPEGLQTDEIYLNGISTSLPEEVQWQIVRSCRGLENTEIIRPGYAVEYLHIDPRENFHSLENKKIRGLYLAGQINGTTGYEEAAAQGLMAGLNVVRAFHEQDPFILTRSEAYIGVLIDDLITKGVEDPYRMFTSRAEHRLLLRQDNADQRLMKYGHEFNLITNSTYETMCAKYQKIQTVQRSLMKTTLKPQPKFLNILDHKNIQDSPTFYGKTLADFLRRADVKITDCIDLCVDLQTLNKKQLSVLEMEIKYAGYIEQENQKISNRTRNLNIKIPNNLDYTKVKGLKKEAVEKLSRVQPINLASALQIPGINPTDIDLVFYHCKKQAKLIGQR